MRKERVGIILVAGKGTRMYPMTHYVSKGLLPVYDKPAIYYSLSLMKDCNITDVMIICNSKELDSYKSLLGSGRDMGLHLDYKIQDEQIGIPNALTVAGGFVNGKQVVLALGDNIFLGNELPSQVRTALTEYRSDTATIFYTEVKDPERFGVVKFDAQDNPCEIIEKPTKHISNSAVIGLYVYPGDVRSNVAKLRISNRGEFEITDLNNMYLKENRMNSVELIDTKWFDVGTPQSLLDASIEVRNRYSEGKYDGVVELSGPEVLFKRDDTAIASVIKKYGKTFYAKIVLDGICK